MFNAETCKHEDINKFYFDRVIEKSNPIGTENSSNKVTPKFAALSIAF